MNHTIHTSAILTCFLCTTIHYSDSDNGIHHWSARVVRHTSTGSVLSLIVNVFIVNPVLTVTTEIRKVMELYIHMYMIRINEPQLPWLQTAIYHTGLDVKMEVTQCAGRVSANTRHHQLRWGDQEWTCTCMYICITVKYCLNTRHQQTHSTSFLDCIIQ